jgi:uncharacterized membrane protein YidH (DUF202 family)
MYFPVSLNSWLMMAIGLVFFLGGIYQFFFSYDRIFSLGLIASGVGFTFFGYTEGFTDPTPLGKLLYRIAMISFLVGIPIVLYGAYQMARMHW